MPNSRFNANDRAALFTPRADQPLPGGPGTGRIIGRVATPSASIAVGRFLKVNPVTVSGPEHEGTPAVIAVDPSVEVSVYLVGPGLAEQGDLLICRFVNYRWVADRGKKRPAGGGYTILGCPCTAIPPTLYLHVANTVSAPDVLVFPAVLARSSKPADLARYSSDPTGYYSTSTFMSSNGYLKFRYWFGCIQGVYFVQGLMTPDSPIGFPGQFLIMTWLVGLPGNSCEPFSLTRGATNSTTYQALGITITGQGPA